MPEAVEARVVRRTVLVSAGVGAVWNALVSPEKINQWQDGTEVESSWAIGAAITARRTSHGARYHGKGTILEFEAGRLLKYNQWSRISRLPDRPENYSVITFTVEPSGAQTAVSVTHEHLVGEAAYEHSNFFWAVALKVLKDLVERDAPRPAFPGTT